ncbi:hypothetical protein L1987_46053 [Smallanthus sonchifolius]|uniref:Uncharacterized protein n=1 Tax=Smallanthus sonchifolius TaxID=185202 RepID=A0ACB9FZB4_9ASTR|nr:hypothetical protein L1987_46053 [Smallanthus sonchifolius]
MSMGCETLAWPEIRKRERVGGQPPSGDSTCDGERQQKITGPVAAMVVEKMKTGEGRSSSGSKLGFQRSIFSVTGYGEDETSPGSARVSGCSRRSRVMVNKSQPGQSRSTAKTMSGFAYERIGNFEQRVLAMVHVQTFLPGNFEKRVLPMVSHDFGTVGIG